METLVKCSAFLFLVTFVAANQPVHPPPHHVRRTVAPIHPLKVAHPAKVAVPILVDMADYNGPYDPADPRGEGAAARRQLRINARKHVANIKSYIPPGIKNVAKKEGIHLAKSEGARFAFSHPKETADLVGIFTKSKGLISSATHKIKAAQENEKKHHKH